MPMDPPTPLQVHTGVHGVVRDATTGEALQDRRATIAVAGRGHAVHSGDAGHFWRLLIPGDYTVTVSATGYEPSSHQVTVKSITP